MISRKIQSEHWKGQKSPNISEAYFTSPPGIRRSLWFVEQLKRYEFSSIFEVGCMSGRNQYHIQKAFPTVKIGALEINPKATRYAREKLNLNEEIVCMDLHDLHKLKDTFDIVYSSGVLIHVVPDDIFGVLGKMLDRASKYVMHIEHNGNGELAAGPKHLRPSYKVSDQLQWSHDLLGAYKQLGYTPAVIKLPDDCKTNGASELLIIEK